MASVVDLLPTAAQITAYLAYVVAVSVPLGLIGSAVEKFGKSFGFPKVEAFGDKVEKFFFDLPGLLGLGK